MRMAYLYQILPTHRLAVTQFVGTVTGDTVIDAMEAVFGDERWQPRFSAVWDIQTIDAMIMLPDEVEAITSKAEELRPLVNGGKAVILARRQMDRAIASLLTSRRRGDTERIVKTFADPKEGADWLELPVDLDALVGQLHRERA